jgi:hypothetical protein
MTRQNLTATMANLITVKYTGVDLLNWSANEITFKHDGGYETLNRTMVLSTTLTTEILQ